MPDRPRYILAGGSGLIGSAAARVLAGAGADVVLLSRSPDGHRGPGRAVGWDGRSVEDVWRRELEGSAGVVNLAGRNVNARWTPAVKRDILASRVRSTGAVGRAIAACGAPPPVWVNASAVGIYGDCGEEILTDDAAPAPPGEDFLGDVGRTWESAVTTAATPPNVRKVILRIGIALSPEGGALPTLARVTRLFAGGRLGSGRQWVPWVHLEDLAGIVRWSLEARAAQGVYNACAPHPATNADLMAALREVLHRPPAPPAPAFAARLAGKVLGLPIEAALASTRAVPRRLEEAGFAFAYPELRPALRACLAG